MLQLLRGLIYKGNPKFPCCFCLYDNFAKNRHKIVKWDLRQETTVGESSVIHPTLISSRQIVLPPLHIKLGLLKQFVKYMVIGV